MWPEIDVCASHLAAGSQPAGDLAQRLAGLWMALIWRQVGQWDCDVWVHENVWVGDVSPSYVEHLLVEEGDVQVDRSWGVLVLGTDPVQFLFDGL